MPTNLVIVESPGKVSNIEKFLGAGYKVMSSRGHIRDLKKKSFSINTENYEPIYEIPTDKKKLVEELRKEAAKADIVWLATDDDREGEAISWHLFEVLGLKKENTRRIVFNEITKTAVLDAIQNPRDINTNLVYAQQARRVLDRIVGFKLSPVLWKKVKPSLSAGRVQSVAARLIVEREREIQSFKATATYRVVATFMVPDADGNPTEVHAELGSRFKTHKDAEAFLEKCKDATFTVTDVQKKPLRKSPALPFTTSTLQQEAARKLGFSVSQTMALAQRLYEYGHITYMRTDSTNLSTLCLNATKEVIVGSMGEKYYQFRNIRAKIKGAQEAHEAIRPTYMDKPTLGNVGTNPERRLYELIYKRTLASQMADALAEKTTVTIALDGTDSQFVASGEIVTFDGFLRVYRESFDDDNQDDTERLLPPMQVGQQLDATLFTATERYTQCPQRYNEAGLVHKLEELGIGRPSTYAPTITTIQNRDYVVKEDCPASERDVDVITLRDGTITSSTITEAYGGEKSKLLPTDIGMVVTDFLITNFPQVLDYNFTANIEHEFDEIASGEKGWTGVVAEFDADFEPLINEVSATTTDHKVGERVLGNDPVSGRPVSAKIGRFGPIVQIGSATDTEKPRFAQLGKGQTIETITLEEALQLCALPRSLGALDGEDIIVGSGRYGLYLQHGKAYASLPAQYDPLTITFDEACSLLEERRRQEAGKLIKSFDEAGMQILNGRFGPYISADKKNYKIPRGTAPADLTLDECRAIIAKAEAAAAAKK